MCRRIIDRWEPCNHMRLMDIHPCDTARGTPGQSYEDCAGGDNCFLTEPSKTPCPVCWRNEDFREHTERESRRLANKNVQRRLLENSVGIGGRLAKPLPLKPASRKDDRSPSHHSSSTRSSTVRSESLSTVCELGEHNLVEIDGGQLICLKCGTIHGDASPVETNPGAREPATPLQSFADDEEGDIASTPRGERSIRSWTRNQQQVVDESGRGSATPSAKDNSGPPSVVDDAPTPSMLTSNARAEESWKIYQKALGRRLPDF